MPVPFARAVTLTEDDRAHLETLTRAQATPEALAFRCRLLLRDGALRRLVVYLSLADNSSCPFLSRLRGLSQPVVRSQNGFSAPCAGLLAG